MSQPTENTKSSKPGPGRAAAKILVKDAGIDTKLESRDPTPVLRALNLIDLGYLAKSMFLMVPQERVKNKGILEANNSFTFTLMEVGPLFLVKYYLRGLFNDRWEEANTKMLWYVFLQKYIDGGLSLLHSIIPVTTKNPKYYRCLLPKIISFSSEIYDDSYDEQSSSIDVFIKNVLSATQNLESNALIYNGADLYIYAKTFPEFKDALLTKLFFLAKRTKILTGWGWLLLILSGDIELNPGPEIVLQLHYEPENEDATQELRREMHVVVDGQKGLIDFAYLLGLTPSGREKIEGLNSVLEPVKEQNIIKKDEEKKKKKSPSSSEHSRNRARNYAKALAELKASIAYSFAEGLQHDITGSTISDELRQNLLATLRRLKCKEEEAARAKGLDYSMHIVGYNLIVLVCNQENFRLAKEEAARINKEMHSTNGNIDNNTAIKACAQLGTNAEIASSADWAMRVRGWANIYSSNMDPTNLRSGDVSFTAGQSLNLANPGYMIPDVRDRSYPRILGVSGANAAVRVLATRPDPFDAIMGPNIPGMFRGDLDGPIRESLDTEGRVARKLRDFPVFNTDAQTVIEAAKAGGIRKTTDITGSSMHRIQMITLLGMLGNPQYQAEFGNQYNFSSGQVLTHTEPRIKPHSVRNFRVWFVRSNTFFSFLREGPGVFSAANLPLAQTLSELLSSNRIGIVLQKTESTLGGLQRRTAVRCKMDRFYLQSRAGGTASVPAFPMYSPNYCVADDGGFDDIVVLLSYSTLNSTGIQLNGVLNATNIAPGADIWPASNGINVVRGEDFLHNMSAYFGAMSWTSDHALFATDALVCASLSSMAGIIGLTAPCDGAGNISNVLGTLGGVEWKSDRTVMTTCDSTWAVDLLGQTEILIGRPVSMKDIFDQGGWSSSLHNKIWNICALVSSATFGAMGITADRLAKGLYATVKDTMLSYAEGLAYLVFKTGIVPRAFFAHKSGHLLNRGNIGGMGWSPVPIYKFSASIIVQGHIAPDLMQINKKMLNLGKKLSVTEVDIGGTAHLSFTAKKSLIDDSECLKTWYLLFCYGLGHLKSGALLNGSMPLADWNVIARGPDVAELPYLFLQNVGIMAASNSVDLRGTGPLSQGWNVQASVEVLTSSDAQWVTSESTLTNVL